MHSQAVAGFKTQKKIVFNKKLIILLKYYMRKLKIKNMFADNTRIYHQYNEKLHYVLLIGVIIIENIIKNKHNK